MLASREVGLAGPAVKRQRGRAGVPLLKSVFFAFWARSGRVRTNGRERRSCSPV